MSRLAKDLNQLLWLTSVLPLLLARLLQDRFLTAGSAELAQFFVLVRCTRKLIAAIGTVMGRYCRAHHLRMATTLYQVAFYKFAF